MWLTVVLVSVIGDVGTTWFGVFTPGIVESSPLWIGFFESGNLAGLLIGKAMIVFTAFGIDYFLVGQLDNWAFPMIPAFFVYSGTKATLGNLSVLESVGANSVAITLVLCAIAIGVVEFIHSRFDYPLFGG